MRILFLTAVLPHERLSGGEVMSAGFVDALRALGHSVTTIGYRRPGHEFEGPPMDVVAGARPIETSEAGIMAPLWMARAVATRRPYSEAKYVSRAFRRAAAADADLVIVDRAQMGWAAPRGRPFVLLAQNVEHRMYAELAAAGGRAAPLHRREAKRMRAVESDLAARAVEVWTLTEEDAAAMAPLAGRPPRVLDVPPTAVAPAPGAPRFDVGLLGTWSWAANAEGLRWFGDRVVPLLDGLDVHVAGMGAPEIPGVTLRGRVPDAMAFLQSARVIAVPSVSGAGVQIKTLDAIASGRPVVATPAALRGIRRPPASVRVEAEPDGFAAALRDTAPAADGRAWAQARADAFAGQLREALDGL